MRTLAFILLTVIYYTILALHFLIHKPKLEQFSIICNLSTERYSKMKAEISPLGWNRVLTRMIKKIAFNPETRKQLKINTWRVIASYILKLFLSPNNFLVRFDISSLSEKSSILESITLILDFLHHDHQYSDLLGCIWKNFTSILRHFINKLLIRKVGSTVSSPKYSWKISK